MVLIAMKPGIVVVDDVRNAFEACDLHPRRKPGQRFLLKPDDIVIEPPPQCREAPSIRPNEAAGADLRPAVERGDIRIVEQRADIEGEALMLQFGKELQEPDAAARTETLVTSEDEN